MCAASTLSTNPFRLPLNDAQFRRALQTGHGRALMHVARYGAGRSFEAILDACIHNRAYDPQCEGDRADWMLQIIDAGDVVKQIVPSILASMTEPLTTEGFWDQLQRCRLAAALASRGYTEARAALYHALARHGNSADLIGGEEIIQLDGTEGLLNVAETMGTWLQADSNITLDDAPLRWYNDAHGEGEAQRVLEQAARQNVSIARYLRHLDMQMNQGQLTVRLDQVRLEPQQSKQRDWQASALSVQDIVDYVEGRWPEDRDPPLFSKWADYASDDELRVIAEHLFREQDACRKVRYLRLFHRRPLPACDQRLIALAEHEDAAVRWMAIGVLAKHDEPEVRELALARVKAGRVNDGELKLFARHYRPGDHTLIERVLDASQDPQVVHDQISSLGTVFERHSLPELHATILFSYEYTPCSICRAEAVEAMMNIDALPSWVREECRFDATDAIRESVYRR